MDKLKRLNVRLNPDQYEKLMYWSARREMSASDYLNLAFDEMIKKENGDYDLPTAEIARLNQLIEVIMSLSSNVKSLESVTVSGFDSLIGLTRGDNYLLEQDEDI